MIHTYETMDTRSNRIHTHDTQQYKTLLDTCTQVRKDKISQMVYTRDRMIEKRGREKEKIVHKSVAFVATFK